MSGLRIVTVPPAGFVTRNTTRNALASGWPVATSMTVVSGMLVITKGW